MQEKKTINVNESLIYLKRAIDEILQIFIFDDGVASIQRNRLRGAIAPVMKTFLNTALKCDGKVIRLLNEAVDLETDLANKHSGFFIEK